MSEDARESNVYDALKVLRETAEEQRRAEADGGYAAGDGPYFDADAIVDVLERLWRVEARLLSWGSDLDPFLVRQELLHIVRGTP